MIITYMICEKRGK